MKNIFRKLTLYSVALAAVSFSSCSLEENNPAGFTKENLATSMIQTFGPIRLINQLHTPNGFGSLQEHLLIPLIQIIGGMVLMME